MTTLARAVVYEEPHVLGMRELPVPEPGPADLVLEVMMCGVDGSELHIINGELDRPNEKAPLILGDEIIGRVASIGSRARAERCLEVGDVVTVETRWPCAENCRGCAAGNYFLCEKTRGPASGRQGFGSTSISESPGLWGGYATHVFVPGEALVYPVPAALSTETALYACSVLANGLRWAQQADAGEGKTVVVIGPGPQGIACVLAASRAGARVIAVGLARDHARLESAMRAGASAIVTTGSSESVEDSVRRIRAEVGDVDAVIETAGAPAAKQLAYGIVSTMGTVVNVSVPAPRVQDVDWMSLLMREVTVKNPMSHPHSVADALALAVALLEDGLDVGDFITHVFGLEQVEQAIRVAAYQTDESPIKVALDPRV